MRSRIRRILGVAAVFAAVGVVVPVTPNTVQHRPATVATADDTSVAPGDTGWQ